MYNKRPVQYVDWVKVFNRTSSYLAHCILYNVDHGLPIVNKNIYTIIRRLQRINNRIDIEHEVMDASLIKVLKKTFKNFDY